MKNTFIAERSVTVMRKLSTSKFAKVNSKLFGGTPFSQITASSRAQNIMLSRSHLLKTLMPQFLGISPNSADWERRVNIYFAEFNLPIDASGEKLDTSIEFDLTDKTRLGEIERLRKETGKKLTTAKDVADYVLGYDSKTGVRNIDEEKVYLYGKPVNPVHYISWLFLLEHGMVANNTKTMHLPKIKYYMVSDDELRLEREKLRNTKKAVRKALSELDDDKSKFRQMCVVLGIPDGDEITMSLALESKAEDSPDTFLDAYNDKNIGDKAMIMDMIRVGILKYIGDSNLIVDSIDPSIVIGKNTNNAITFLNNPENASIVSELKTRYKQAINNK